VNERRQRPHVIGQFLALVAQRLNLGLGRRIGDREPANLGVRVAECNGSLVGSGWLRDGRDAVEPDLAARGAANDALP
jgi:hypothetical protein